MRFSSPPAFFAMIDPKRLPFLVCAAATLAALISSCRSTESSLADRDERFREGARVAIPSTGRYAETGAGGRFDPCQEFEHRAERSHLAWEDSHHDGRIAAESQALRLQAEAKMALDAATELYHRRADKALTLQAEEREYAARLAERANDFRSEVLLLSGLREHGSDRPPTAAEAPNWERFVVLEDPPANLWFELDPENRLAGERRRLTLQETMFTEFPKYQERSSLAREELYIAKEKASAALEAKEQSRLEVLEARKQWEAKRTRSEEARSELRDSIRSRTRFIEARASLEECRGEQSPSRDWLNALEELTGIRSINLSLNEALDRGQDEIERLARPGYRTEPESALAQARQKMGGVLRYEADAHEALERAAELLVQLELSAAERAAAQTEIEIAREALRRIRLAADEIPARIEASLDLACAAEERFFADSGFERKRREIVEQRLDDASQLTRLRQMSPFESLHRHWDEMRLFERLPEKLELMARGEFVDLSPELVEAASSMARTFRQTFHPCEPHLGGSATLERFQARDGGAASRAELLRRASDLCELLLRIDELTGLAAK